MSQQLVSQTGGTAVMTTGTTSSTFSSTSSSSSSFSATSSSSSTTKVMKQTTTTTKSASSSSSCSSRSSSVNVRSSGMNYSDRIAGDLGIDVGKEMERLRLCMSNEMANIHSDMFRLVPGSPDAPAPPALEAAGVGSGVSGGFLVKLDDNAVRNCIDKAHDDRMKLNFDVQEFDSETINIKTVGNKIEVHAMKKSKKGDEERSEEFSRVYELPTDKDVDASKVTSSIYQDGVLTIELPVADALGQQPHAP